MPNLDEPAPDFVVDTTKGEISLSNLRGKWVVLFAYPADFTPICETDIIGFARNTAKFDDMGVQFIGWSVDSTESHAKWIREVKERTGVQIDYPLIADVDKKLAQRYGVLHKTKGVTYRGVFVIDPDGILKFSAIYPMDVGRSIEEVERTVKILQRARELSSLANLDRARELSGMQTLVGGAERLDPLQEAERIVRAGEENGVVLRLIGGLAIRSHCHGRHSAHLRDHHDIDMFGLRREYRGIESVFSKAGYSPNKDLNRLHGERRLQFLGSGRVKNIDVFLDKFMMQHTLDFRRRIRLDDLTIPITDLLLTKLQMEGRIEAKDAKDIVAILEDHDLGHSDDKETLNLDYMASLCGREWGLFETVLGNLRRVRQFIEDDLYVQCVGMEANELTRRVDAILDSLILKRKSARWKARAMLGRRLKWYRQVSEETVEV
jgi:peroxiredoxin (alkyl hydroperoxide reductase subunit C)